MGSRKKRILILCTGNSCRSQMAEGWFRFFAGDRAEIYSAGIEAHGINPYAAAVMKEAGVDISGHTSNKVDEYAGMEFDYVLTVCNNADEKCPVFPGKAIKFHQDFPDPSDLKGTEEEKWSEYRRVRDLLKEFCKAKAEEWLG